MPQKGKAGEAGAAGVEGKDVVAKTTPIKPAEEIIKLVDIGDWAPATSSEPRRRQGGKLTGDDERPPEPKFAKAKMGAGIRKFSRGSSAKPAKGDNLKQNRQAEKDWKKNDEAVFRMVKGEVLQTEEAGFLEAEGREKTWKYSQSQIAEASTVGVAKKKINFTLPYGSYSCDFTRNGQYFLVGGRKGHVAMMRCDTMQIESELQLKETVRAVQTVHNHTLYAVAQKKYVYMYDSKGVEIHCIKDQRYPSHLDFLPYHFLLVSAGDLADLHYRDISTGQEVANHRTKLGPTRSLRQNPTNGVMHVGHSNGCVTMWTPSVKTPVVKMFCHAGHVTSMAVHGDYMLTSGAEGYWKVWDLRKYESVHTFKTYGNPAADIDVSMTGLVGVGFGSHLQIWKDVFNQARPEAAYLKEEYPGKTVSSVRFRPYEDVLGVGHSGGFETLLVPGAGFANFDSFESNPFETKKQRQEREVHQLLEKLQPDSIMLDPSRIGSVDKKIVQEFIKEQEAKAAEDAKTVKKKKKMRGKDKVGSRMKRKKLKDGKDGRKKAKDRIDGEDDTDDDDGDEESEGEGGGGGGDGKASNTGGTTADSKPVGALGRFYGKRRRKT